MNQNILTNLNHKKIILGVSGGIAAYKACELVRRLQDQGADVHVVLTQAAQKFVTPLSFQALSQNAVHTNLFDLTEESQMGHIQLADEADLVLIAPTSADLLAKMSIGMADDLLTTLILVTRAPVFLVPAMNVNMWEKSIVQENIQKLQEQNFQVLEPAEGNLACGWQGKGRLPEVPEIVSWLQERFGEIEEQKTHDLEGVSLQGKRVLINAGPTREFYDPVRFLSNPSSGKMGFALAREAQRRGAQVTLVAGPVQLETPKGVQRLDVVSAEQMLAACEKYFEDADIFIATAAVADYRFKEVRSHKMKKSHQSLQFELEANPDILKTLAKKKKTEQCIVGFAAETEELKSNASKKLKEKNLDLIIVNDVSNAQIGFASDKNQVVMIDKNGQEWPSSLADKRHIASEILDKIAQLI